MDAAHPSLTLQQQCELLGVPRSSYDCQPQAGERSKSASAPPTRPVVFETPVLQQPQDGCRAGSEPKAHPAPDVILGIEAHYRKPNLSRPAPGHQVYPYLLRRVEI